MSSPSSSAMSSSLTFRTTDSSSSARSSAANSWRAISTGFRFKVYSLVLMRAQRRLPWPGGIVASMTILLSLAGASQAAAATQVRFLHALPGGPTAELTVKGGTRSRGHAARRRLRQGLRAQARSVGRGDRDPLGRRQGDGLRQADAGRWRQLHDRRPEGQRLEAAPSRSTAPASPFRARTQVRAVNAAPELGRVTMSLSGQRLGHRRLRPGHRLQARRPRHLRPVGHEAGHRSPR